MDPTFDSVVEMTTRGFNCFAARGQSSLVANAKRDATLDVEHLRRWHDHDTDYHARADEPDDGLWAFRLVRDRDAEFIFRDSAYLPNDTWTIELPNTSSVIYLFARSHRDADYPFALCWRGTNASFQRSAPLPGSLYRGPGKGHGQRYRWRDGMSIYDLERPAPLPLAWLRFLPGKPLPLVSRDEFDRSALRSVDMRDSWRNEFGGQRDS